MLFADAPLTFGEVMTHESVPLAVIFRELFTWLAARPDAVLFGAQAVNAYCEPPRMTEDVDVLSTDAAELAESLRAHLAGRFHIAVRVREVAGGFRVYQLRQPKNLHLCDVRAVASLPPHRVLEGVQVAAPEVLAAMKAESVVARATREKGLSDKLDLVRLLRVFPELKQPRRIAEVSAAFGLDQSVVDAWTEVARLDLAVDED